MSNENLFLNGPQFEKTAAMTFLSKDPSRWVKEVISQFLQKYPFLQDQPVTLDWKVKSDTKKGYAVGCINVLDGKVPVVIEDFRLHPLDLFIHNSGIFVPLNEDLFKMLMQSPEAFKGLAKSKVKDTTQLFSPHLDDSSFSPNPVGRFGATSGLSQIRINKYASVLDQISTLDSRQIQDLVTIVQEDDSIKQAMEQNGTIGVLEKVANKPKASGSTVLENYVRNLDVDRQFVYSDNLGNHYLKQANSGVDRTWEVRISEDEAREQPILLAEDKNQEKTAQKTTILPFTGREDYIELTSEGDWQVVDNPEQKTAEKINLPEKTPEVGDFGAFLGKNGLSDLGRIKNIEKSANFDDLRIFRSYDNPNRSILVNSDREYAFLEKESEFSNENGSFFEFSDSLEDKIPSIGDYGVVLTKQGASQPFEVTSTIKTADQPSWEFKGFDGLNKIAFHVVNAKVDGFEQHETVKNAYYVDSDSKFVPLDKQKPELVHKFEKLASQTGDLIFETENGLKRTQFYLDSSSEEARIEKLASGKYKLGSGAKFIKLKENSTPLRKVSSDTRPHFIGRDGAGLYYLKGDKFAKYADNGHNLRNLTQNEAAWSLIHCGGTEKDLRKLASIDNNELQPISGDICPPLPAEKMIGRAKQAYDKNLVHIDEFNSELLKSAAAIGDKNTMDSILSLGLMNKQNISEYLDVIPTYEFVMSELAKLLLLSRLGVNNLPSEAIKTAMDSLTRVVLLLKKVKATMKEVK